MLFVAVHTAQCNSDSITAAASTHCDSSGSTRVGPLGRLEDRDGKSARERGVGLGLLISAAVIAYGAERGCKKAEILAINDDGMSIRGGPSRPSWRGARAWRRGNRW